MSRTAVAGDLVDGWMAATTLMTITMVSLPQIARQNDVIRRLQSELHQVERSSEENVRRTRTEAEKQEAADRKNTESKLTKQHQDLGQVKAQYATLLAAHRESEQSLRKVIADWSMINCLSFMS